MIHTFPFRPVTNKVPPKPKPKPGQRTDGPSLFGKAWAALPVWPAVVLLFALSGCSLFFPVGPYGRIPDLQTNAAPMQPNAKSGLDSAETPLSPLNAMQPAPILDPAAFAKLTPGAQRRYARALRAANTAPRKIKTTGRATAVVGDGNRTATTSGNKSATATDSAQPINAPKADNVAGAGATQTVAEATTGFPWWGWVVLAALAYGAIRVFNRLTS